MAENNGINFEEKLIPLFTQDMIYWLNMPDNDKYNYKQHINNIYEKNYKNNYNLKKFLSNIKSNKNIIYTYTNIENQLLNNNDNIENHNMNIIFSNEKTRILDLNINTEDIESIFQEKEFNLYIIKISEEEIIKMKNVDEVINLIKGVEKYNNNKIVVYIIYKKRKYNNGINKEKIEINNINKITEKFLFFNQIFIDNLFTNYERENMDLIFKSFLLKGEEIINENSLMNEDLLNEAFENNIIENNGRDKEKIKNALKNNNNIYNIIKNRMKLIIRKRTMKLSEIEINDNNKEFLYHLHLFNKKIILDLLKNIINYLLSEQALQTILFTNVSNDVSKNKLYEDLGLLIDKFSSIENYENIRIKNIYFGFNLLLFNDYKELYQTLSKIKLNENDINDINEKIILNERYKFRNILNSEDKDDKKFLFNDYILFYIYEKIKLNLPEPEEKKSQIFNFMNFILKQCLLDIKDLDRKDFIDIIMERNDKKLNDCFKEMCLFLHEQHELLSEILNILNELSNELLNIIIFDFYDKFNSSFAQINNNRNNYYYNHNNKLYIILEIFLIVITDEFNFSFYFNDNIPKEAFINLLKKSNNEKFKALITRSNSQSMLFIDIFLYIISFEKSNDHIKKIINILKKEGEINLEEYKKIDNKILLNILIRKSMNDKSDIINIINIFASNGKYVEYSFLFFNNIIGPYININSLRSDNLNDFFNISNYEEIEKEINNILKEENNISFKENLLFYFETYFELFYFKRIEQENAQNDIRYKNILENKNLNIVKQYLTDCEEKIENNILNTKEISIIFKISFIKIYFRYFANIMLDCKNGTEIINFNKLAKEQFYLNAKNLNPLKKYIVNYIINNLRKRFDKMTDFNIFISRIDYLENNNGNTVGNYFISNKINNIPNLERLIIKFNSDKNNKKSFPLLNYFIDKNNNKKIEYLKHMIHITYVTKIVLDEINRQNNEINPEKEIKTIVQIDSEYLKQYIQSFNYLLKLDYLSQDFCLPEKDVEHLPIKYFYTSENCLNNELKNIFNKFIEYQENFIFAIKKKYFENKNIGEIYIQSAKKENIVSFNISDDEFLKIFINNCLISESGQEFKIDFDGMEHDLKDEIIPGLKRLSKKEINNNIIDDDDIVNQMNS